MEHIIKYKALSYVRLGRRMNKKYVLSIMLLCGIFSQTTRSQIDSDWGWIGHELSIPAEGLQGHFNVGWADEAPIGVSLLSLFQQVMGDTQTYLYLEDYIQHAEQLLDRYFALSPLGALDPIIFFKIKFVALIIATKYGEEDAVWNEDFWECQNYFSLIELWDAEIHFLETIK